MVPADEHLNPFGFLSFLIVAATLKLPEQRMSSEDLVLCEWTQHVCFVHVILSKPQQQVLVACVFVPASQKNTAVLFVCGFDGCPCHAVSAVYRMLRKDRAAVLKYLGLDTRHPSVKNISLDGLFALAQHEVKQLALDKYSTDGQHVDGGAPLDPHAVVSRLKSRKPFMYLSVRLCPCVYVCVFVSVCVCLFSLAPFCTFLSKCFAFCQCLLAKSFQRWRLQISSTAFHKQS